MKSSLPKVLHRIAGRSLLGWVLDTASKIIPERVIVVTSPDQEDVRQTLPGGTLSSIQEEPLGTGDAVKATRAELEEWARDGGSVIVLFGADPLITEETIARVLTRRHAADNPAVVVLGFETPEPGLYGRLIASGEGALERIVEARDANAEELAVTLCNSGVMAVDGALLFNLLSRLTNDNAKGEFYLTDLVGLAREAGRSCGYVIANAEETIGVDSRLDLAEAEAVAQKRLRRKAMENGVTLISPETTFFSHDTELGADVIVEPNVVFAEGVKVEAGATIKAFSHLADCRIGAGVQVGPFARLRGGAEIAEGAYIGNFVEVKNATFESGAKASHLSYIGDARVGAKANIGAGTITCNYDGFSKSRTEIGAGAFIGSNSALVAPVAIGDGAIVGAGSTVTSNVADDAIAVVRADTKTIKGGAARYRAAKQKKKDS